MKITRNEKADNWAGNANWIETEYASVAELVEHGQAPCDMPDYRRASQDTTCPESWDYGVGYQGALELVKTGWVQGAEKMRTLADAMYEKIAPQVTTWHETEHAISGACVDVGAYLTGAPECMLEFKPTERAGAPPVDIVVSICASYKVTAEQICNKGAAILAAIDVLEQRGCAVSVRAEFTTCYTTKSSRIPYRLSYVIILKRPGEVLDVDAMAFVLMHPAMSRRLIFAAMEHAPAMYRKVLTVTLEGAYGRVQAHPNYSTNDNTIYIGPISHSQIGMRHWETPKLAVDSVLKYLKPTGLITDTVLV